jgi:hypothetical protein
MSNITPPPPHLLKKFSTQARDESNKRNGAGYLKTFAILCIEWAMNSKSSPNDRQIRSSEITPPPELVQQWNMEGRHQDYCTLTESIAARAAAWGADKELDACCEEMKSLPSPFGIPFGEMASNALRNARRPKPPSLKKQALGALSRADKDALTNPLTGDVVALRTILNKDQAAIIRRALEQLDG